MSVTSSVLLQSKVVNVSDIIWNNLKQSY